MATQLWLKAAAAVAALSTTGVADATFVHSPSLIPVVSHPAPIRDRLAAARDMTDRMTVSVTVNGQGPFPFVIDTGADRTVISRELADRLGLKPGDPVRLNSTSGVALTPTARIDSLGIGTREVHGVDAPLLSAANLGAMGMLGIDSLKDQRIVMDFLARRLTVEPSHRERFGSNVIVVRAKSRLGHLVVVDAAIGGRPIFVILDSGAQNTVGNFALRDLLTRHRGEPLKLDGSVISVAGGATPVGFLVAPEARIGDIFVHNLPIAVADLHTFDEFDLNDRPAMLLGMDLLRQFDRVAVDFHRKQVTFRLPDQG